MKGRIAVVICAWGLATPACVAAQSSAMIADDVAFLASEERGGRGVGSAGSNEAALFIAQRYIELGLQGASPAVCLESPCSSALFQMFEADGKSARNILAAVVGSEPALRGRFVIVGAHFDHLGRSPERALDPERQITVRPGADDNASGTAAVLEIARRFAIEPPPISVVFAHFDAEELGLLGSQVFVERPSVRLDSVALMVNLDMVGRLETGRLQVDVGFSSDRVESLVRALAIELDIELRETSTIRRRSDHGSFSRADVPTVAFFTGFHDDYHRVTDTPDKVDIAGVERVVDLAERLVRAIGR